MSAADMPPPGPDTLELRMQRPNKLFVSAASRRHGEQSSYLVVSDGATLSYWRSWTKSFVQTKAPAVLADIARQLPDDAIGTFADHTWEDQSILEWDLLADDSDPLANEGARRIRWWADDDRSRKAGWRAGACGSAYDTARARRLAVHDRTAILPRRGSYLLPALPRARGGSIRRTVVTSRSKCSRNTSCSRLSRGSATGLPLRRAARRTSDKGR